MVPIATISKSQDVQEHPTPISMLVCNGVTVCGGSEKVRGKLPVFVESTILDLMTLFSNTKTAKYSRQQILGCKLSGDLRECMLSLAQFLRDQFTRTMNL